MLLGLAWVNKHVVLHKFQFQEIWIQIRTHCLSTSNNTFANLILKAKGFYRFTESPCSLDCSVQPWRHWQRHTGRSHIACRHYTWLCYV